MRACVGGGSMLMVVLVVEVGARVDRSGLALEFHPPNLEELGKKTSKGERENIKRINNNPFSYYIFACGVCVFLCLGAGRFSVIVVSAPASSCVWSSLLPFPAPV